MPAAPAILGQMRKGVQQHCLPLGLLVGVAIAVLWAQPAAYMSTHTPTQLICVIIIFLISGLKLRLSEVKESARDYRSWMWGIVSILVATPIVGAMLTRWCVDGRIDPPEMVTGMVLFFLMPCTISSGIVLSVAAGGSFALALMLTVVCNIGGIFTVPPLAQWLLPFGGEAVQLDVVSLLLELLMSVLAPLIVGKLLELIPLVGRFASSHSVLLTMISNVALALVPWMKVGVSMQKGIFLQITAAAIFSVLGWGTLVHFVFLLLNRLMAMVLRLKPESAKSVTIVASQKTLPVALAVAAFLPVQAGDIGLIALPCIMLHVGQIICDSVVASLWKKYDELRAARDDSYNRFDKELTVPVEDIPIPSSTIVSKIASPLVEKDDVPLVAAEKDLESGGVGSTM